jgi:hypothetical protein
MRLGTETGSLVNHILTSGFGPEPYVGMPATICYWTDRTPATVVEVNMKGRYIVVQDDDYKRVDSNGMSESQVYEYTQNPENYKRIYRKNKKGVWVAQVRNPETGRLKNAPSGGLCLGEREKYHDFSF